MSDHVIPADPGWYVLEEDVAWAVVAWHYDDEVAVGRPIVAESIAEVVRNDLGSEGQLFHATHQPELPEDWRQPRGKNGLALGPPEFREEHALQEGVKAIVSLPRKPEGAG